MSNFDQSFLLALDLVRSAEPAFLSIVALSVRVSGTATLLAAAVGLPLGALLAIARFPGRGALVALVNAALGLPPVVVGLVVYLLLSRSGPLGEAGLLFTPSAMVIAQAVLVTPIVAALARQVLEPAWEEYADLMRLLGAGWRTRIGTLLWDLRFALATVVLAAFGRAVAEVGAVMVVGGNIAGHTRTMTTAIALETSKGDLPLALGLGIVLVALVVAVNGAVWALRGVAMRRAG